MTVRLGILSGGQKVKVVLGAAMWFLASLRIGTTRGLGAIRMLSVFSDSSEGYPPTS